MSTYGDVYGIDRSEWRWLDLVVVVALEASFLFAKVYILPSGEERGCTSDLLVVGIPFSV